jgi:hypothetical protein
MISFLLSIRASLGKGTQINAYAYKSLRNSQFRKWTSPSKKQQGHALRSEASGKV